MQIQNVFSKDACLKYRSRMSGSKVIYKQKKKRRKKSHIIVKPLEPLRFARNLKHFLVVYFVVLDKRSTGEK